MCTKITNLLKRTKVSFSYEVTPAISKDTFDTVVVEPTFYSVTWHAKGHGCSSLDIPPLQIARFLRKKDKVVLLHITCDQLKKCFLELLLKHLLEQGICNLFVVLGERYDEIHSDFKCTASLITFIRATTGDQFCIGVAGYPDDDERLLRLKEKVDVGADFVITQAIFDANIYETFEKKVRRIGIEIPIIPGVFLFRDSEQLSRFIALCKLKVSDTVLRHADLNDNSGLDITRTLIENLIRSGSTNFHCFTLNKLSDISIFLNNFSKQVIA